MPSPFELGKAVYDRLDQCWTMPVQVDDQDAVALATYVLQLLVDEVAGKPTSPTLDDAMSTIQAKASSGCLKKVKYEISYVIGRLGTPQQKARWAAIQDARA